MQMLIDETLVEEFDLVCFKHLMPKYSRYGFAPEFKRRLGDPEKNEMYMRLKLSDLAHGQQKRKRC